LSLGRRKVKLNPTAIKLKSLAPIFFLNSKLIITGQEERSFDFFYINRIGIGPLPISSNLFDFGLILQVFVIKNRLPAINVYVPIPLQVEKLILNSVSVEKALNFWHGVVR
jgi:hypothetical protein